MSVKREREKQKIFRARDSNMSYKSKQNNENTKLSLCRIIPPDSMFMFPFSNRVFA